jgi:hypothetical protein
VPKKALVLRFNDILMQKQSPEGCRMHHTEQLRQAFLRLFFRLNKITAFGR